MKIIQFTSSLASGGRETFVVDLTNELVRRGHEVHLVTMARKNNKADTFNQKFVDKRCIIHHYGLPHGRKLFGLFVLPYLIRKINPDVVHAHAMLDFIDKPIKIMPKAKFVYTLHSRAENLVNSDKELELSKRVFLSGRIVPVTISSNCRESYIDLYGRDNSVMIENGRKAPEVTDKFDEVKKYIDGLKRGPQTKVFFHAARFDYLKNQDLLIDGFNILDKQGKDFILIIAGRNFESPEGKLLQERACPKIHFVGEQSNIADWMMNADAFCLSSRSEGLPISILEALSLGKTPICTNVGGIKDILTDSVNSYLSDSLEAEDYVAAVSRYFEHPIEPEILKKYYADRFSIEKCADEYLKIYEGMN